MKTVNVDKMDELRDKMMEMKFESDYMNEMMNRNYDMDLDED
jgi:charged multivesicular body protein 5